MIVRYTVQALADSEEAFGYIAQDRPAAAREVGQRIRNAINGLASLPNVGRPGRVSGTRELMVPPFVIAYRVSDEYVDVLAILHGARLWPSGFGG